MVHNQAGNNPRRLDKHGVVVAVRPTPQAVPGQDRWQNRHLDRLARTHAPQDSDSVLLLLLRQWNVPSVLPHGQIQHPPEQHTGHSPQAHQSRPISPPQSQAPQQQAGCASKPLSDCPGADLHL